MLLGQKRKNRFCGTTRLDANASTHAYEHTLLFLTECLSGLPTCFGAPSDAHSACSLMPPYTGRRLSVMQKAGLLTHRLRFHSFNHICREKSRGGQDFVPLFQSKRPPCVKGAVKNLRFLTGGLSITEDDNPSESPTGDPPPLTQGRLWCASKKQ